jgi:ribulose-phosphate 3-epimerase
MSRRDRILGLRTRAGVRSDVSDPSTLILPSMLLCDFTDLRNEVGALEAAGFRALHLDVMDGVFVPNFSYGLTLVRAFREVTDLPLDVHLMMVRPQDWIEQFAEAGADSLTFHIEAVDDARAAVQAIHEQGMAAGIAIDRDTPVSAVADVAAEADIILVMTIKAGFGGQQFMPAMLAKLDEVRRIAGDDVVLEVDGGVHAGTIQECVRAGAQWLVAGSAVFRSPDYRQTHDKLLELANVAAKSRV